jgi:septation ring formation regulator EzrA
MMDNITLEKHLKTFQKNITLLGLVIGILTSVGVCYGFYFKTNDKLELHSDKINTIEVNIVKITDAVQNSAVYQGATKEQIRALENQIGDIKKSQDRIEDKLTLLINK